MATGKKPVVAAIDFGTTYSGYGFSFKDNPKHVKTNQSWSHRLVSYKTPTSVLVDDKREFHSFGYDAESKYSELWEDGEGRNWALFRRFKMTLYNNTDLSGDTPVQDISKTVRMPIRSVFAMAIKFLKDHLLSSLTNRGKGQSIITEDDVFFVITVPAIWDDKAKLLMREAALEAGIAGDSLAIALESEAASLWCQTVSLLSLGKEYLVSKPGTKYMVVDLGGGTADITVHQSLNGGKIHELDKASGGDWGGTRVDQCFIHMLTTVMGKEVMSKFTKDFIGDLFDMLKEFETSKRTISSSLKGKFSLKIPASLRQLYEETKVGEKRDFLKTVKSTVYDEKISVKGDRMRIDVDLAKDMFQYSIKSLCAHINDMLEKPRLKDVSAILLVGGFSECPLVHEAMTEHFSNKKLVFPHEGGLAVLKGAVLYGHTPGLVATRIARFTYGLQSTVDFDPNIHPADQKKYINDVPKCTIAFRKYIEVGQEVTNGFTVKEKGFPTSDDQSQLTYNLYISNSPSPVLVTDSSCSLLGVFTVPLPRGGAKEERGFEKAIVFGDTELLFRIKHDKTGKIFTKYFNFL